jgi:polyhydroxybutyrate depolymerase
MKRVLQVIIPVLFAISCSSARHSADLSGVREMSTKYGGRDRICFIHVPEKVLGARQPLLLALHGGGGDARGMLRLTKQKFNALSDMHGFYVAYPEGIRRHWNDFHEDPISYAHDENIDDVGFISSLIDTLAAEYPIDPDRVFVTGISNGGFMSYRLACELSLKIRGIAAVTATHSLSTGGKCRPERPVNIMVINGTDDPLVPYNGGEVMVLGSSRGRVISTDDTVRFWTGVNKCSGAAVVRDLPDNNTNDGTRVKKTSFGPCAGNARVVLYRIEGGGHTWPGGMPYLPKRIIGNTSRQIDACDVIWEFFSSIK